jgi:hypothetical protein
MAHGFTPKLIRICRDDVISLVKRCRQIIVWSIRINKVLGDHPSLGDFAPRKQKLWKHYLSLFVDSIDEFREAFADVPKLHEELLELLKQLHQSTNRLQQMRAWAMAMNDS